MLPTAYVLIVMIYLPVALCPTIMVIICPLTVAIPPIMTMPAVVMVHPPIVFSSSRPTSVLICIESDDFPVALPEETKQNTPQSSTTPMDPFKDLATLQEIFPEIPASKLHYVYTFCLCLFSLTVDFLLGSHSLASLQNLVFTF